MPTFSAVGASLMQTSTSSPTSAKSTSGSTNESFASHLEAANGKKAKAQNSAPSRGQATPGTDEKPVAETANSPQPTGKEKTTKNQKNNESDPSSDIPEALQVAVNQPSVPPANVHALDISAPPAFEAPVVFSKTERESMLGRMLSSISELPNNNGKNTVPFTVNTNNTGNTENTGADLNFISSDVSAAPTNLSESASFPVAPGQTLSYHAEPAINGTLQYPHDNLSPNADPSATTIIFDPSDGSITTTATNNQLPEAMEEAFGSSMLIQNKDGQIITIEQNKVELPSPIETNNVAASQLVHRDSNNFDLNGHYLHSHLPNETASKGVASSENTSMNNEQSQSSLFNGGDRHMNSTVLDQQGVTQDSNIQAPNTQHLSFSYQVNTAQTTTSSSPLTAPGNTFYQLGSGNIVPDSAVVDQMIAHFSVNNRLQTGSVNLKLYPQELGELRMEIKVEQDNVKAHIVAQSPHAQEMIDRHMPRLREALEQQGLHLQQVEVTVAAHDNASGEPFQDNSAWQHTHQSRSTKPMHADFNLEFEEEIVENDQVNNNLNVIA